MPLVPCPCKPQASSSRGWAWAAFSRRLGRGRGSCGEKPSRQGAGAQSPAQGWRTDRADSALCWQCCVPALAGGRQPVGERGSWLLAETLACLLQRALGNPLRSQALQTHSAPESPGARFHPHPAVSHYPLWLNRGLCAQASWASQTLELASRAKSEPPTVSRVAFLGRRLPGSQRGRTC